MSLCVCAAVICGDVVINPKDLADFVDFGDLPPNVRMTVANCQRAGRSGSRSRSQSRSLSQVLAANYETNV